MRGDNERTSQLDLLKRYRFKGGKPWAHQMTALEKSVHATAYGLLMEQGTGKSRVIVDTAGILFSAGKIDALFVIAPNGVQRGWVREHVPNWISPSVPYVAAWYKNKLTRELATRYERVWDTDFIGLRVFTMNYETLITKGGFNEARKILRTFRCLLVADESHKIANDCKRTERALDLSAHAPYRRILTGTLAPRGPFGVFHQMRFLDEAILDQDSFVAFKAHHAEMEDADSGFMRHINKRLEMKHGKERARHFKPQIVKRDEITGRPMYRNVKELRAKITPHTYRVLKIDCMDLPPKVYERRDVDLNSEQRRIYNSLRDEFFAEFGDKVMAAPLAMVRMARLQQIVGGFFKEDAHAKEVAIGDSNPKLDELFEVIEEASPDAKFHIWARFKSELRMISSALQKRDGYPECVAEYWGEQTDKQKDANKTRFATDPRCRYFVAQQQAGGTGLDGIQVASVVVYFSNDFALVNRQQSEDRAHRGGMKGKVTIIDLYADDTLDAKIIDTLRANKEVADEINGDNPRKWI